MSVDDTEPLVGEPPLSGDGRIWTTGATVGRFVILGTLGSGGMGMVFSAYDPVLDRKVALKTLRAEIPDPTSGFSGTRLVREAQAMARVQHPNVCAVHDIGAVEGRLFVAMELVDGDTLRPWMKQRHPWREVLAMFIAAGRGLEAAHAAGLVHRDFKPENVLLGSDGRPRVSDFGLVSLLFVQGKRDRDAAATTAGGTPGYMPPEQLRGEAADSRSDQFAFCVALWEALEGERPFPPNTPADQRRAPDKAAKIRPWLAAVIARGLSPRPQDRWPSMTALLTALARDPARVRLRWLGRALVVLGAAAAVAGVKIARNRACADAAGRLAAIWDAPVKRRLQAAFASVGGGEQWTHVAEVVDGYTRRWTATHEEACRATRLEGRQSDTLLDLRMGCLERRRATLAALVGLWSASLDDKQVERAPTAAASLPPLDECSDARALSTPLPLPEDANRRAAIAAVRGDLDRVRALFAASEWGAAKTAAERAQPGADATAYPPVQAEARMLLGTALDRMGDPAAAATLEQAAHQAALAHDDPLAARSLMLLAQVLSNDAARFERALGLLPAAAAFVARAGDPPELRGRLLVTRGQILLDSGDASAAKTLMIEGAPLLASSLGAAAPETLMAESVLAGAAEAMGDYDTARKTMETLLHKTEQLDGVNSPETARVLTNLGMVESDAGRTEVARGYLLRALAIRERRLGSRNAEVAQLHIGIGNLDFYAAKYDAAAARYQQAIEIFEQLLTPDHAYLALSYGNLGAARRGQGRLTEALSLGKKSVDMARQAFGAKHPQLAMMESEFAATLRRHGDFARARANAEEALAILNGAKSAPGQIGSVEFELAQDYWGAGDEGRALAAAVRASAALAKAGEAGKSDARKLEEWLKTPR
jgi:tetratricopeptide (TPR) repeat protein